MGLQDDFSRRLSTIAASLITACNIAQQAKVEVESRVARVRSLLPNVRSGSPSHPMGADPFLAAEILFELDRCECILDQSVPTTGKELVAIPGLWLTALRRAIALLLYVRGRRHGFYACYDSPMLCEVIYFKSPAWLLPFIGRLLPKARRRWEARGVVTRNSGPT